ncbi:hypothetical protein [Brevibacillus massiliensis]|jgi:hypothetical protein|uniref:hypothetical protein n=1 Tax=Brevibacillus massiliensis TaxID=1118054 RepID=UPI000316312A|nr:hypothetical protein [Brevibacillus massiliensis]
MCELDKFAESIQRLREKIAADTRRLEAMEQSLAAFLDERERRSQYLSSRELSELIARYSGRRLSMTTIKRWADLGHLGKVLDEREQFPLLTRKQGRKRSLYHKSSVYPFLWEKNLLRPKYDVLDVVRIRMSGTDGVRQAGRAVVLSSRLCGQRILYQLQTEESMELWQDVPEEHLSALEEEVCHTSR